MVSKDRDMTRVANTCSGAWNCDGQMFGVNSRDESSGSPDL